MTVPRRLGWAVALLVLCACQDAPVQTNILLEVRVAQALAKQVTRVEVHAQKPGGSRDEGASRSSDYEAGDALRFVLQPSAAQTQLQVRVVALHDRQPLASAVLRSRYESRRGLYLKLVLGCEGERDLGELRASDAPSAAIDSCKYHAKDKPAAAGAGGSAGSGTLVSPVTGGGGTSAAAGGGGHAGAGQGGAGAGGAGRGGAEAGSGGAEAGSGGAEAGSGGAGGAGAGGAGRGGAEAGSPSSAPGCYSWRRIARIADVETLMPEAFSAGVEQRENPLEEVKQYICLAAPPGTTSKLVGKASKWGCYMPGAGTTASTVDADVEVLISSNSAPCLRWRALDATHAPTSALAFGSPNPTRVCRVFHEEIGENRNTKGPRVGQVRQENGQWVCRYEFYSYLGNPTRIGQPGEVIEILE